MNNNQWSSLYCEVLFSIGRKKLTDTCNAWGEFQRHTDWDKPASQGCFLYDSIYLTQGIAQGTLWDAGPLLYPDFGSGYTCVRTYRIIYQRKKSCFCCMIF